MTLDDLAAALRRFWGLATAVFVVIVGIGALIALIPTEQFRSTETMLVQPASKDLLAISSASEFLTPPVIERAGSQPFEANVRNALPAADKNASLSLSAENKPGTGIVFIRADSPEPRVAEEAAKAAASLLIVNPISSAITISVLTPATTATSTASTRRAVILVGSIMLGLIMAILAVVAARSLRPRPSSAEFAKQFGLPVLGEIPANRGLPPTTEAIFNGAGSIEVMEASEKLAVNVELLVGASATVAVTSWAQGEGKTVVTAQLAWALARLGHSVTAIDCDLRKPALHRALGVNPGVGVVDLAGDVAMRSVRQRTALRSLDVIAAGDAKDRHPAEVIGPAMERVSVDLARRLVVVDTPPLFGAETSLIAAVVDAVILVVDARRTNPVELREALRDLKLSNANVRGVVLNRTRNAPRRRGTYRYYGTGRARARA